ncbi:SET and MYND domain-containing protein 4 [Frankliniella fusca]|uniref:SET and MYND domain-containing protein 4 n=1 Tax=Frankliniella fusca TaxID=407009 RepID=A0AAE1LAT8_9NEOP|nr:SET and MYND domain-containing protein 4 [Frankliniella fusca]
MSDTLAPWPHVLDVLTRKAKEWSLMNGLLGKKNEFEIAKTFMDHEALRSYLLEWMENCIRLGRKKSSDDSIKFRTKGNDAFKRHNDSASLSHYTDCIRYAPHGSEEHALGLANRSAVLYHMKRFKECVIDAEKALSLPYPDKLRTKLLLRQSRCYLLLGEREKCESTLKQLDRKLSDEPSNQSSSTADIKQEIHSILSELSEEQNYVRINRVKESLEECIPTLLSGTNSTFPSVSSALELKYSNTKGRFVITNQDVKQGDVLFVEKPYTFVVLPDQFKDHCHHCAKVLIAPIPCSVCVDVLFCSDECEKAACSSYHHWECGGISLMSAVGVAHLGLRIILATGPPSEILEKADIASQCSQADRKGIGCFQDSYSAVHSLIPHIEDMALDDIFQYAVTAELLSLFLIYKTDYFKEAGKSSREEQKALIQVRGLLLRHIAQLVCNAHAITKVDSDKSLPGFSDGSANAVVAETQQRIATAIYPSASMMNHSCDPNIINRYSYTLDVFNLYSLLSRIRNAIREHLCCSFFNEILIVKASRNIPKGEEVFNCYGPHFQRMGTAERQAALQAQYFFFCDCTACVSTPGESIDPTQERLWALKCSSCGGPLIQEAPGREPSGSKVLKNDSPNSHLMVCDKCGSHQPISNLVCDAFSALSLFRKGCEEMEKGDLQIALSNLNQCRELQERALYHVNKDLSATYDMLAKCYATLGNYSKSIEYLELMLPSIEEQYGANSIEVANELQKLSDVMLCNVRTMETIPPMQTLKSATKVVERGLSIFSVHYGKWNQGWQDLDKKLQELKLMEDMASCPTKST